MAEGCDARLALYGDGPSGFSLSSPMLAGTPTIQHQKAKIACRIFFAEASYIPLMVESSRLGTSECVMRQLSRQPTRSLLTIRG
jgi:hypothetical protein